MLTTIKSYLSQVEAPSTVRSPADEERNRRRGQRVYDKHKPVERELHPERDEARARELGRALRTSLRKKPDSLEDAGRRAETDETAAAAEHLQSAEKAYGQAEKLALDQQRADRIARAGRQSGEPDHALAGAGPDRLLHDGPATGDAAAPAALDAQSQLKGIFLAGERILSSGNPGYIDEVLGKLQALRQTDAEQLIERTEQESATAQRARLEGSFAFLEEFYGGLQTGSEDQLRLQGALALARAHVLGAAGAANAEPEPADNAQRMPDAAGKTDDRQRAPGVAAGQPGTADSVAGADRERKRMARLEQAQSDLSDYLHALVGLADSIPTMAGASGAVLCERLAQIRNFRSETSLARLRNARNGAVDDVSKNIAFCLQKIEQACDALPTGDAGKERLRKVITEEKKRLFKDEKELADAATLAQLPAIRSHEREIAARKGDTLALVTVRAI